MTKTIKKDLAKVNKLLHPKSRKARKLHQKASRIVTVEKSKKVHAMRQNAIGEKLQWFKERLISKVKVYSSEMCLNIIEKYLNRFDDELEQIAIVHSIGKRKNRRFARREDIIKMTILHDKEEFETCGLEIPDLMNEQQLECLRNWNGELRFLQNFSLRRYTRKALERNMDSSESCNILDESMEDMDRVEEEEEGHDDDKEEEEEEEEEDDSEWSDVSEDQESEKKNNKIKKGQRKKSGAAQSCKLKKFKKMDVDV